MSTGVFAFRMLVCQFRRELTFDGVFGFWERLWAAEQMAACQLKVSWLCLSCWSGLSSVFLSVCLSVGPCVGGQNRCVAVSNLVDISLCCVRLQASCL